MQEKRKETKEGEEKGQRARGERKGEGEREGERKSQERGVCLVQFCGFCSLKQCVFKGHVLLTHHFISLPCDQAAGDLCHRSCRKHVLQLAPRHHESCHV